MEKRYQIFISSTYTDLKEERDKVMRAVLDLNYFPAGMEQFPAAGIAPIEVIKSVLKDCDYYILIIGARYGSIGENGKSFTEEEYDYAVSQGIPVIAFLHGNPKSIPIEKSDKNDKTRRKLESFRKKVEEGGHTVKYWNNPDDLSSKVLSSIPKAINYQPRVGWVRADSVVSGDSNETIDKLERQIDSYKNNLQKLKDDLKKKEEDNHALETSNQEAQKEINSLQETIKILQERTNSLEVELEKYKSSSDSKKEIPQVETIPIPGTNIAFNMVHVEGGMFMMGANESDDDAKDNEKPAHQVVLSDYWIGETQVTQELWEAVMGDNPSLFTVDPNCPVENVSWVDCKAFISKLNTLTGKKFRLPTEAEWEFAARGGNKSKGYMYAGGNDINDVARYKDNSGKKTNPVGELAPNELGLYDMSGNVWEWCQDEFEDYSITQAQQKESKIGVEYVVRGGAWFSPAINCRVSFRYSFKPSYTDTDLGLRLALGSTSFNNTVN